MLFNGLFGWRDVWRDQLTLRYALDAQASEPAEYIPDGQASGFFPKN